MVNMLLDELLMLEAHLRAAQVPLILGGGMGLYLRDAHLPGPRSPRYPVRPQSRSTEDLDVFLSADVIVDAEKMNNLRDVLDTIGYQPDVKYMQFRRQIGANTQGRTVRIDLLAAPPARSDRDRVKLKPPRVRPQASEKIHGYLTCEAAGIHIGTVPITMDTAHGAGQAGRYPIIHIPSSLNYLILKLHAFHDRRERSDPTSNLGRHHAFDIFRIVTDMREADWENAAQHVALDGEAHYVQRAAALRSAHFADNTSLGTIRLRENEGYRRRSEVFDAYLEDVLADLKFLFDDITPLAPAR